MRAVLPALLLGLPTLAAAAAPHAAGKFGQWQAATHAEGSAITCFVFTRAEAAAQHIPGRGDVVLSVTRRPRSHDVVAISAGFELAGHEDAQLQAGATRLLFYIANRSAFARDNAAAIATFSHEASVSARLPGPHNVIATDRFSLRGFTDALAAMAKACPP